MTKFILFADSIINTDNITYIEKTTLADGSLPIIRVHTKDNTFYEGYETFEIRDDEFIELFELLKD